MDASSGHWDYDISLVDYTTIPIYMLARGKDGNRLNTDLNCDAAMIYSGAGADCTNKMMVKDCPTKHITKNCMEMCQSPILLCKDFGGNQSLPPFCNDLDDAIKQFNTENVKFDQDFINNKLGLQYDTPQSFIYGGLQAVANSSGIKDLVKDKNPAIYKTILTGINTGRCSLDDIKNSECNPITRDSCMSNGTKGNVFPILQNYQDEYIKEYNPKGSAASKGAIDTGICSSSDCRIFNDNYGNYCRGQFMHDWKNIKNPYNKYAHWASTHGNGRFYTFPFDDDRGNINSSGGLFLDIVIFPDCGSWGKM